MWATEIAQTTLVGAATSAEIQLQILTVVIDAILAGWLIIIDYCYGGVAGVAAMDLLVFCSGIMAVFEMLESLNGFGAPHEGGE